jgi:hypothetical protein
MTEPLLEARGIERSFGQVDQLVASLTGGKPQANIGTKTFTITQDGISAPEAQQAAYKTSC